MMALVYHGPGNKAWEAATFELVTELVRRVGRVANIGVHGQPATILLERLWDRDVTITTGLVDTYSTPTLLRLLTSHQIDAERFVAATSTSRTSSRPTTSSSLAAMLRKWQLRDPASQIAS